MRFDVSIAHEAPCTRVVVIGEPTLGRLLSLVQVLEVDCGSWPRDTLLLDLRGLRVPLSPEALSRLAAAAARLLRCVRRIALLAGEADQPGVAQVRFFGEADAALKWLAGSP
ncbi:hypothetical protein GCM10028796_26700 [Ramlibacter monticola]|uniref:STAS/SEC14 domain-containing protein n=1 Tax=Ramlibacter monticola TaxID=1926872 RepID=A0A937CVK1_9BURK|nr:hypothetical protein [Ramlibacter monticola]MBL0393724.1 hypothetical protein [Ramlibacter monticola]